MHYILLIIFLQAYGGHGATAIEFSGKKTCMEAQNVIYKSYKHRQEDVFLCLPKGY